MSERARARVGLREFVHPSVVNALASPGLSLERTSHSCLCLAQTCAEMIRATVDDYGTACSLLQNHAQTVCCVRMCVCACVVCQGMLGCPPWRARLSRLKMKSILPSPSASARTRAHAPANLYKCAHRGHDSDGARNPFQGKSLRPRKGCPPWSRCAAHTYIRIHSYAPSSPCLLLCACMLRAIMCRILADAGWARFLAARNHFRTRSCSAS